MGSASRSSFFGFEIAKTGLFISQHNLNVTGHNISNVNTPGYTRQRLITSAIEPYSTIGKLASYEHGILGGGTSSHYIEQLRSSYLDREFRMQNSSTNTWNARLQGLEFIEQIFDEPNEVGILSHIQDFHNALSDLATTSTGEAQRTALQNAAKILTDTFNQYYRQLTVQQSNLNNEVETKVNEVNSYAERIGELNKLIYNFEMTGEHANDLRDQRNLLLDELSCLVEIDVVEYKTVDHEPARLRVSLGEGASKGDLVNHTTVNKLHMEAVANSIEYDPASGDPQNVIGDPADTIWAIMWDAGYKQVVVNNPNDANNPLYEGTPDPTENIADRPGTTPPGTWFTDNYGADPANNDMTKMFDLVGEGEIKGTLTLRDGDDSENIGIPYLVHQLDTLARAIVEEFNKIHNSGYRDSRGSGPETGIDFFDDYGDSYDSITAGNFKLDDNMTELEDVWNIACSDEPIASNVFNEGNNRNTVKKLLDLFASNNASPANNVANFHDFYNSFLIAIGTTTKFARTEQTSMQILATSADTQRMSISAVSIDEEMTNLIKFQHAYAASSRVITAMDEALDRIINSTGVVGR